MEECSIFMACFENCQKNPRYRKKRDMEKLFLAGLSRSEYVSVFFLPSMQVEVEEENCWWLHSSLAAEATCESSSRTPPPRPPLSMHFLEACKA